MTDENPVDKDKATDPPANPPADKPADPPAPPAEPPAEKPAATHDQTPVLAAISELKDIITAGINKVDEVTTNDQTPVKKPWFARGGKS